MSEHLYKTNTSFRQPKGGGTLYYVRLKTSVGILYKLGYTTLSSVEERLAYQGRGDEKLLDRVLFFKHFDNAAEMESAAHEHFIRKSAFGRFSNEPGMPLFGNGQSELYAEDILGVDPNYLAGQSSNTLVKIMEKRMGYNFKELTAEETKRRDDSDEIAMTLTRYLGLFNNIFKKLTFYLANDSEKKKILLINDLMSWSAKAKILEESRLLERQYELGREVSRLAKEIRKLELDV